MIKNFMVMTIASVVLSLVMAVPVAQAQMMLIPPGFIIDQRTDETTGNQLALTDSIPYFSPIGQEFVPDHGKLVGADVYVTDFGGGAGTLNLKIRHGTIDGPILASRDFFVETRFEGWKHISFLPPVKLSPGSLYVLQVETVGQTGNWGIVSDGRCSVDTYPKGDWLLWGYHYQPECHNDLAFRTYTLKSN